MEFHWNSVTKKNLSIKGHETMDMMQFKGEILKFFKKHQLKEGVAVDPEVFKKFLENSREKRDVIDDTLDECIMKGLLLETRFQGRPSFALTRHGEEVAYRSM